MKVDVWKNGKLLYEDKNARQLTDLLGFSYKSITMWITGERKCTKGYVFVENTDKRQRRIPRAVLDEWDEIYKNAQVLKQWDSMHKYARR